MKKSILALFFSITLGVAVFSGWRFVLVFSDKQKAENEVKLVRQELITSQEQLRKEVALRESFSKDKLTLEAELKAAQENIAELTSLLSQERVVGRSRIFSLINEIKLLNQENVEMREKKAQLEERLSLSEELNLQYEARFHSLVELKKAIRDLKSQVYKSKKKSNKIFISEPVFKRDEPPQINPYLPIIEGNQGYIVKDGAITYKPKIKIEVKPAND